MEKRIIAAFQVTITGTADATWQGVAEAAGEHCQFQSELQLLQWMMEQCPTLRPDVRWEAARNENRPRRF